MSELKKTPETYSDEFSFRDFVADGELTVTITLAEYRSLVAAKASADARISQLFTEKHQLQNELKTFTEAADAR